jgi:hypothetical protein
MLGAALEKLFGELCQAIQVADPKAKLKPKLSERIRQVVTWCRTHKAKLRVGDWTGDERVEIIDQVGHFIRKRRNDAGHPKDPPAAPTHEQMYDWLVVFPEYCTALNALTQFLAGQPGLIFLHFLTCSGLRWRDSRGVGQVPGVFAAAARLA